jgi:hypothetical protein
MKDGSLEEALDRCIKAIDESSIETVDKVELLLNIKSFLKVTKYRRNIALLQKAEQEERFLARFQESQEEKGDTKHR